MKSISVSEDSLLETIPTKDFLKLLLERGFNFFSGVPCSIQADLINEIINEKREDYVTAPSEGDAIAIASGAWLSGKKGLVLCQNSGLFDILGSISSILLRFKIPLVLFVSWRGYEEDSAYPLGKKTLESFEMLGLSPRVLKKDTSLRDFREYLDEAEESLKNQRPFVFLVQRGIFDSKKIPLLSINLKKNNAPSLVEDFIEKKEIDSLTREGFFLSLKKDLSKEDFLYMANEGYSSRHLFLNGEGDQNFYLTPLGYLADMALGVSLYTQKAVMAIDGDGALLMRLGSLAVFNMKRPVNFVHVVLDNGVYQSTGGQISPAYFMDLSGLATHFGYRKIFKANDEAGLKKILSLIQKREGPYFVHLKVKPTEDKSTPLKISPSEEGNRFRRRIMS
jgi:phosphonopyruvate decarboxylase